MGDGGLLHAGSVGRFADCSFGGLGGWADGGRLALAIFLSLTLPIMQPTIVTNILLVTLLSLANFSLIYIMTAGGPGNATNILPIYSYQQAFEFNKLGYGALIGDVIVIIATIFAYLYVRVSRRPGASYRPEQGAR